MPKRILHVVTSMDLGGIQTLLMTIYRNINRNEIQFDFVMMKKDCFFNEEIRQMGGRVYYIPKLSFGNLYKYYNYWNVFFDSHTEYLVVHGHVRSSAIFYLLAAKRHKLITIMHSHSQFKKQSFGGCIKEAMQYPIRFIADSTIACSYEAACYLFGKRRSKDTYIMGNLVDTNKFSFNSRTRVQVRKELSLSNHIVIGTIGRIVEEKNPEFIVEIACELVKRHFRFKFLWIGDGYLMDVIKKRINDEHLDDYFLLMGAKDNSEYYLQAMDIFLLCSKSEGFGISAIESQASGLPTLLSDKIPTEVAITPLARLISIEKGVYPWVEEILRIDLKSDRGKFLNQMVESDFNVTKACNNLLLYYNSIIDSKN